MTTVADEVGRTLAGLGADHVFGVVGSGNFHVTNALVAAGVPFVAARHENGAAVMADAYARLSGKLGVLTVHQGPGLTNAMTGITEAAKSRTPMLVLAADTGAGGARSNFALDQAGLAAAVGAGYARLSTVDDVARAARLACVERRTVLSARNEECAPRVSRPCPKSRSSEFGCAAYELAAESFGLR